MRQRRCTGNSFFASSTSLKLIDFLPWRKKRWPASGCPAPVGRSRSPVAAASAPPPYPATPTRHVLPQPALGCGRSSGPASKARPEILRDLPLGSAARPNKANRLLLKFLRKPALLLHEGPLASSGPLHFHEASPATAWSPISGAAHDQQLSVAACPRIPSSPISPSQRRSPQGERLFSLGEAAARSSQYTPAPTPSTRRASVGRLVPYRCRLTHMPPRAQTPSGGRPRARGARHDQSGGR